jgi:hypothetical protein
MNEEPSTARFGSVFFDRANSNIRRIAVTTGALLLIER